jgi:hypothetical protein
VIVILVVASFALGIVLGHRLANRQIDHRWYCGQWHRATERCEPLPNQFDRSEIRPLRKWS